MSWTGCLLGTDQPGWLGRLDLPLVGSCHTLGTWQRLSRARAWWALALPSIPVHGWLAGDSRRTWDGACRSPTPGLVVGSGGLRGPAVWLDAVLAKQLPQALDLAT